VPPAGFEDVEVEFPDVGLLEFDACVAPEELKVATPERLIARMVAWNVPSVGK
jgi:hypothetical protein